MAGANRPMAEPLLLRIVVGVASLVPVIGGAAGVLLGPAMVGLPSGDVGADSHFRYLSGLLLGLGLMFGAIVPRIEQAGPTFRILGTVVIVGGLARLLALVLHGPPNVPTLCALAMELGVTPALMIWQARAAARARSR